MAEGGNLKIVASEGGDIGSHSNHGTSTKRRKILIRHRPVPPPAHYNPNTMASYWRDVGSNSKNGTSTKQRRITFRVGPAPPPENRENHGTSTKLKRVLQFARPPPPADCENVEEYYEELAREGPRVRLHYSDGICGKEDFFSFVEIALSTFNEENVAQGPVYELVSQLECILTIRQGVCHFNFIAKPKNGSDCESKLFFAEISYDSTKDGRLCQCTCVCIIGPPDSETGLGDCRLTCQCHPGRVHHPKDGFMKVFAPRYQLENRWV